MTGYYLLENFKGFRKTMNGLFSISCKNKNSALLLSWKTESSRYEVCVFINWLYKTLCCFCYHSREENKNCVWGNSELPFKIFLFSEINLPAELWRPYNLIARITLITKTQSWLASPIACFFVIIKVRELFLPRNESMRPYFDESWSDIGIFYWHLCRINSVCSLFSNILSWSDGREASIWCQSNWILSCTNDIFNVPGESLSSGLALGDQFDKK